MKRIFSVFKIVLLPFSAIYSAIAFIRNKLYDWKILPSSHGILPSIIIGNLTVGGTGKTPMTIFLAQFLSKKYKLAILSRGYKRKSNQCIISNGKQSTRNLGDEPKLIAQKTGLPVAICSNRHKGLKLIKQTLPKTEIVILDDAFQHRKLIGNLNILLIDYNKPVFNDLFLPTGRLRDNLYRIKQADIIIFTKCPHNLSIEKAKLLVKKTKKNQKNVFFTTTKYHNLINPYTKKTIEFKELYKYKTITISGIANNKQFTQFLNKHTKIIKQYSFADHKQYKLLELKKIFYNFAKIYSEHKVLITTEKDFVKIEEFDLETDIKEKFFVLPVSIEFLFNDYEHFKQKIINIWKKIYY